MTKKKNIIIFAILLIGIISFVFLNRNKSKPKIYDYMIAKEIVDFDHKDKTFNKFIDSLRIINKNTINGFSNIFCYLEIKTGRFTVNVTPLVKNSLELEDFKDQIKKFVKKYMLDHKIKSIGGEFNTNEIIKFQFYTDIDFKLVYSKNRIQRFKKFNLNKEYLYDGKIDRWIYLYDAQWMLFQQ